MAKKTKDDSEGRPGVLAEDAGMPPGGELAPDTTGEMGEASIPLTEELRARLTDPTPALPPAKPHAATHADDLAPRLYAVTMGERVRPSARQRLAIEDARGNRVPFTRGATRDVRLLPPVARQLAGEGWGVAAKE